LVRDVYLGSVEKASVSSASGNTFTEPGNIYDPDRWAVLVFHGDEVSVEGYSPDKRFSSVDGVEDPGTPGGAFGVGFFFSHDGIVGKSLANALPQKTFGAPIGGGYRRAVLLAFNGEVSALECLERVGTGLLGNGGGELYESGVYRWGRVGGHGG